MDDKTVVLNAGKVDYDGRICYADLASQVTIYEDTTQEQILDRVAGHTIVVTKELPVPGELLRQFPACVKLICEAGTGYNNIDLDAAREKGIAVCNVPAYSTHRVAHTALLLLLTLSSSLQVQQAMLARGNRDNFTKCLQVNHVEVNGKTLGVVGEGNIGREVIKLARAMDMNVLVYTRTLQEDREGVLHVPLEKLLRESDYISLHCPLTPQTQHILDQKAIAMMKPTAFLINTSRGGLVDEAALVAALEAGKIAGAGLDVQEVEPPAQDSPLYRLENVVLTPHMGWKGLETRQRLLRILKENIEGFLSGRPIHVVS
ncbi:MAG: NAD(P)-dependent oxidoreductase [Candidatus Pararuminococcus gallinarum]|jgi:glycerate dehydrogenase